MKKRIFAVILAFMMFAAIAPPGASADGASGTCGDNLTWTFEGGTLTISGTGDMDDFQKTSETSFFNIPWIGYSNEITSVTVENGVTSIGARAFYECANLTNVMLSDSIADIGTSAFYGCASLAEISLPESVSAVNDSAFEECQSLTHISLPDSLTSIGDRVFYGCASLAEITLPESLLSVGIYVFNEMAYYNNESNWDDGILYAGSCLITAKHSISGKRVIRDGVVTIADEAFNSCGKLSEITLPSGLKSIGGHAFTYCVSLNEITIGTKVESISELAFSNCGNLMINVDESNEYYSSGDGVLFNKDKTTLIAYAKDKSAPDYEIPSYTVNIGNNAFAYCENLKNVTFPESLLNIGSYAFYGCTRLAAFPEHAEVIGYAAFRGCANATSLTLTAVSVGGCAFANCSSLTDITLTAENIGSNLFYSSGYYKDKSNWDGDVLYLENYLVAADRDISGECIIRDGTATAAEGVFSWHHDLTSVTIPSSLTRISDEMFYACTSLTEMTIPADVTYIGSNAFRLCSALTDVYYGGSESDWNAVIIAGGNDCLTGAVIHFTSASEAARDIAVSGNIIANNGADERTAVAIIAEYDENGTLIGTWGGRITLAAGESVPYEIGENDRLFAWNSLDGFIF